MTKRYDGLAHVALACVFMAHIVMAHIVMAHIVMAEVVMAHIVPMSLGRCRLCSLYSIAMNNLHVS